MDNRFSDIIRLIEHSRANAVKAVNTELINLYWNIGLFIKQKLSNAEWGDKTVDELAVFIKTNNPKLKGFNRPGLYRMLQFHETYESSSFVAAVRRQIQSDEDQQNIIVASMRTQFEPQNSKDTILVKILVSAFYFVKTKTPKWLNML